MKDNKTVVRLLIEEAINKGNVSILKELIHSDYRYSSPTETMHGRNQLKAFILSLRTAFPDLTVAVKEQIGEEEKVCTRVSMTGSHLGDFMGMPGTGKRFELQGVIITQFGDGLIVSEWELLDQLTLLQQLGVVAQS